MGRGAQLQLFRPGSVELKKHYAELPIAVKVVGGYMPAKPGVMGQAGFGPRDPDQADAMQTALARGLVGLLGGVCTDAIH